MFLLRYFGFVEKEKEEEKEIERNKWEKLGLQLENAFTPNQQINIFIFTPNSGIRSDISTVLILSSENKLQIEGMHEKKLFFSSKRLQIEEVLDRKMNFRRIKEERPEGKFIFRLDRVLISTSIFPMVCFKFQNFKTPDLNRFKFLWFAKFAKAMENVPIEIIQLISSYFPLSKSEEIGFTYFAFYFLNDKNLETNFKFINEDIYHEVLLKRFSSLLYGKLDANQMYW
jgi:hypothetical protein